jgi:hypothetical protein
MKTVQRSSPGPGLLTPSMGRDLNSLALKDDQPVLGACPWFSGAS